MHIMLHFTYFPFIVGGCEHVVIVDVQFLTMHLLVLLFHYVSQFYKVLLIAQKVFVGRSGS